MHYCHIGDILASHCQRLFSNLQAGFWDRPKWKGFKQEVELLARALQKYCNILKVEKQKMLVVHHLTKQIRTVDNSMSVQLISPHHTPTASLHVLSEVLEEAGIDSPLSLQDSGLLPQECRKWHEYTEHIKQGLHMPVVLATYSPGSNLGNLHWIWCTSATDISSAMQSCQPIIERVKVKIPSFHIRAMRQAAFEKYGLISPHVKKAVFRHLYKDLLGDSSSAATTRQEEVDERVTTSLSWKSPILCLTFEKCTVEIVGAKPKIP